MKRFWWCLLFVALLAPAAPAQETPAGGAAAGLGGAIPAGNTLVKAVAAPVSIAAGGKAVVHVKLTVLPGWHVNANPPSHDYFIPTKVALTGGFGVSAGPARYPAPRKVKLAFEESEMWVWDGETEVAIPLAASVSPESGRHVLTGRVDYQGCNDQVCVAPAHVPFTVEVTVTGGVTRPADSTGGAAGALADTSAGAAPPPDRGAGFVTGPPPGGSITNSPATGSSATERRLQDALARGGFVWFLALFIGGLLLNLTPCVFPMLGITVSIFGARRKEALPKVIVNAVVYVLGLCVTYSALGVAAALTGGLFGAALQNVWVSIALGLLLVALSLSMFGVYEMSPPTWVLDRAGGADTGTMAGLFVSGLFVGIVAAPCVGPFVVALLAILAQRGDAGFGFASMFTLSLGLGFPYLFLATFSGLLQTLPKSGEWMDWVKKFFGLVLATLGLSYVLLALAPSQAPYLVPTALVLGGLYLGFMEKSGNRVRGFRLMKSAAGLLAVAAGVWLILQVTTAKSRSIAFSPYDEKAVQASLAGGRGVLIDFAADWCVPCHELELQTFPDPRVVAAARGFDAYKVDLTNNDSPESTAHRKRYAVAGVPTIVFLRPGGDEVRVARVEGFVNAAEFVKRLEAAGAK